MNTYRRVQQTEMRSGPDLGRHAAIADAAVATLSDEDLAAVVIASRAEKGTLTSYDQERFPAARKRAPSARRTLAALRKRYAACGTIRQAEALYRAARGREPDYAVFATLQEVVR